MNGEDGLDGYAEYERVLTTRLRYEALIRTARRLRTSAYWVFVVALVVAIVIVTGSLWLVSGPINRG